MTSMSRQKMSSGSRISFGIRLLINPVMHSRRLTPCTMMSMGGAAGSATGGGSGNDMGALPLSAAPALRASLAPGARASAAPLKETGNGGGGASCGMM